MEHWKSSPKREINNITNLSLKKKTRTSSNIQTNFTLKDLEKKKKEEIQPKWGVE